MPGLFCFQNGCLAGKLWHGWERHKRKKINSHRGTETQSWCYRAEAGKLPRMRTRILRLVCRHIEASFMHRHTRRTAGGRLSADWEGRFAALEKLYGSHSEMEAQSGL